MGGKREVALYVSSQGRCIRFPHFRYGQRAIKMNRYTNAGLVDIHFNYGPPNGNGRFVVYCMEKYMQQGGNRIIKSLLAGIRT
ncbi:hypothetical protein TNCV_2397131 [Trichonephila clavipes]|uniref:Uncharacterized protein n=1 Tax=Trichonephila clavipes TaxID=2585209 RepID=A0A8X6T230_TRICX|nr:hypothetical protein TNCV_2397131 [Trichonephila clavipes]